MKLSSAFRVSGLVAVLLAFAAPRAVAQQEAVAPGASPTHYKISKLTSLDKDYRQRARGVSGSSAKSKEWGVFDVTFLTQPTCISEISITYTVMLQQDKPMLPGDKPMTVFQTTVAYPDIVNLKGKEHTAGVVLQPGALARHGKPIGFAVQIFFDGQEVAAESEQLGILANRKSWWTDSVIMNSPNVARRDGCLMDRMQSPFQLVEIDNYEVSR